MLRRINTEINNKPNMPRTLKKFKNLLVLSNSFEGKIIPINEDIPIAIPKNPRGIPKIWAIKEKAELSQLRKLDTSQNEPSKIDEGKFARKKCRRDRNEENINSKEVIR